MPTKEQLQEGFRLGSWEVLPAQGVLRCGDQEESPEPKVFELLIALAVRDGDVATKDDLIDEVWGGYPVGDDSITRCVAQLRKHLGEEGKSYVKTLSRRGYRLGERVTLNQGAGQEEEPRQLADSVQNRTRLMMVLATVVVTLFIAIFSFTDILPTGQVESIGVLPFENLSGDAADQYRVSGFKAELVQTLHSLPGVTVKHGRVAYPNVEVSEIAKILEVDAVLFGELQHVGDTLKITYRIAHGRNGEVISTGVIEGQVGEDFALQEEMAYRVRAELLGEPEQQLMSSARHPNSEAYDRYLRGLFLFERRGRGRPENLDGAIELLEEAITLDPEFGPAYLSLASAYALLPDYRNAAPEEAFARALRMLERGTAMDGTISDAAGVVIGYVHHKQRNWMQAERSYIQATTANIVESNAFNWYSLMLGNVGRLEDALQQALIGQRIDPSSVVINTRLGMVYTWLGDNKDAAEFFDRAHQLDASWEMHMLGRTLLLARDGRMDEAATMFDAGVTIAGGSTEWLDPFFAALRDPAQTEQALLAIDAAFSNPVMDRRVNVIVRTVLGDTDGAMDVAMTLAHSDVYYEIEFLFAPELEPLRQHPEFMTLMEALGVSAYWEANQCVWRNDRVRCPS